MYSVKPKVGTDQTTICIRIYLKESQGAAGIVGAGEAVALCGWLKT